MSTPGFSTASGKRVSVSEESLRAVRGTLDHNSTDSRLSTGVLVPYETVDNVQDNDIVIDSTSCKDTPIDSIPVDNLSCGMITPRLNKQVHINSHRLRPITTSTEVKQTRYSYVSTPEGTYSTVEPLYCGHHWDRSMGLVYRGVLISECPD